MRNWLHKYGFVIFLGMIAVACSKVPGGLLSEKDMQSVLIDMQLAEAMIYQYPDKFPDEAHKKAVFQSVFQKHEITEAVYDSSLVWYGRNLDIYMGVCDRVLAELNKRQKALGDVQINVTVDKEDSIDIWPRRRFLTLEPDAIFNGVAFNVEPKTSYSSGSAFVLGMNVWGINEKWKYKPEVRLSVFQGDTTITVNKKISKDGYYETIVKSLPTKRVKSVYGHIFMNNADSASYYKVYVDSLSLMKYNYGRLDEIAKPDSTKSE
ncbi:DUF4296 domain-containing protein [Parabacteroides sp. APC149_11_2_Y6]